MPLKTQKEVCPVCNSEAEFKYKGPSRRNGELNWYRCTNEDCNAMCGKKGDTKND